MTAIIKQITNVESYGENLSIVTTNENDKVIANRKDDGNFRWEIGELCVYISEGSILSDDLMKERGYYDLEKDRGFLDGGKRNRVKMKKLAGFESRGLLFKTSSDPELDISECIISTGEKERIVVSLESDVSEYFDIIEFQQ